MADDGLQATEAVVCHVLLLEKPAMQIVAVLGKAGPLVDHKGRQAREFHTDSKPTAGSAAWRSMRLFVAPDSISLGGTLQVGDWEEDADNLASLSDWKGRSILLAPGNKLRDSYFVRDVSHLREVCSTAVLRFRGL